MFLHADSEDSDQIGRTGHFVGFVIGLFCILKRSHTKCTFMGG